MFSNQSSPYRSSSPQPISPSKVVVVAVNGDSGSDFAFHYAINQAASTSADRIHIINGRRDHSAINYAATGIPEHSPSDKAHKKQTTEAVLTKYAMQCHQNKKNCTFESVDFLGGTNALATRLCDRAQEQKASELVIGSTGKNAFTRMLIGSVGQSAAESCPCNVTVVRPSKPSPSSSEASSSTSTSTPTSPSSVRLSKSAPNPSPINKWVTLNNSTDSSNSIGQVHPRRASFAAPSSTNNHDSDRQDKDRHHSCTETEQIIREASQLIQNIML